MWDKTPLLAALLALAIAVPSGLDTASHARPVRSGWTLQSQGETLIQARILSLRDVIEIVRGRFGGELINARLEDSGGRPFYMLRWRMPDDNVVDIRVDAVSGQVYR